MQSWAPATTGHLPGWACLPLTVHSRSRLEFPLYGGEFLDLFNHRCENTLYSPIHFTFWSPIPFTFWTFSIKIVQVTFFQTLKDFPALFPIRAFTESLGNVFFLHFWTSLGVWNALKLHLWKMFGTVFTLYFFWPRFLETFSWGFSPFGVLSLHFSSLYRWNHLATGCPKLGQVVRG